LEGTWAKAGRKTKDGAASKNRLRPHLVLWAEAINLGAWDVPAKPFEADEVIRIVNIACQHWQDRHGVYNSRATQRKSAKGTGYLAATGT
jgi:DNA-binding NtrC family response regulator